MAIRQQPRRSARILALLSLSQMRGKDKANIDAISINDLMVSATRTLIMEVENNLETAADELNRSNDQLIKSDTRATNITTAQNMLKDAIALTQKAINRLGGVIEIPEFVQLSKDEEVKEYAVRLIRHVYENQGEIDKLMDEVITDWSINRLTQIDANILRIAVTEMYYFKQDHRVAINEAVEVAKQYSDDDGYRFINGVLRKVSDKLIKEIGE